MDNRQIIFQEKERHILHLNIANFFIAVAVALQPRLLSYPVVVATPGSARRILLDVSQKARQAGIYRGMLLDSAKKRCSDLRVLDPCPELYDRAGCAVLGELTKLSPRLEPAGPGHFFVDLTGTDRLWGIALDTADRLKKTILEKFRLSCAVGLARNKLVSKVAARVIKPAGLCEIMAGGEADFMAPLPLSYLPGLDQKIIAMLRQFNLKVIGDLVTFSEETFHEAFGPKAGEIRILAQGVDDTPVREYKAPEPFVQESFVFEGQTNDDRLIEKALFQLVSKAGFQLRKMRLAARKLELAVRYADGVSKKRQLLLKTPICGDLSLFEQFLPLLYSAYTRRIRLSRMVMKLSRLTFPYGQLDLFGKVEKERKLMKALDSIRTKFGPKAITFWGKQA